MKGEEEAGDLCILCNSPDVKVKGSGGDLLMPHLRVLYLVGKVFRRELEGEEGLLKILQVLGNPEEWFTICGECGVLVDRGIEVWRRLKWAEREHIRILGRLQGKLVMGEGEGNCGSLRVFEGMNMKAAKRKVRRWLRGGLNEPVESMELAVEADVKEEPTFEQTFEEPDALGDDWVPSEVPVEVEDTNNFEESSLLVASVRDAKETKLDKEKAPVVKPPKKKRKPYKVHDPKLPKVKGVDSILESGRRLRPRESKKWTWRRSGRLQGELTELELAEFSEDSDLEKKPKRKKKNPKSENRESLEEEMKVGNQSEDEENYSDDSDVYVPDDDEDSGSGVSEPELEKEPNETLVENVSQDESLKTAKVKKINRTVRREFLSKCAEYLDHSLLVYPPVTPEDLERIPNSGVPPKNREEDGYNPNGAHACPRCPKRFSEAHFAIAHIQLVHFGIKKPWKCPQCSYSHYWASALMRHVVEHWSGFLVENCKLCGNYYENDKTKMNIHIIDHQKGETRPQCPDCHERFVSFSQYTRHMLLSHGYTYYHKYTDAMVCDHCGKALFSKKRLEFHRVQVHGVEDKNGTFPLCASCGEMFYDGKKLREHVERVHEQGNANKWVCEHCGNSFVDRKALNNHVKKKHVFEPETCNVCGLQVNNATVLKDHKTKHHKESMEMTEEELEVYKRRKEEEMAYSCTVCGQRFAWSVLLYHHQRGSHPEIKEKYKCDLCGKGFTRPFCLKRHRESEHEGKRSECRWCGKTFIGDGLKQHVRNRGCEVLKKKKEEPRMTVTGEGEAEGMNEVAAEEINVGLFFTL